MQYNNKQFMISLGLLLISATASADITTNDCRKLQVTITNHGPENCLLVRKDIAGGNLSSAMEVPAEINANEGAFPFEMIQNEAGPRVVLTYQCGKGREITFESQQGMCYFTSGNVYGSVLDSKNMMFSFTAQSGSFLLNQPGTIDWTLSGQ